MTDRMSEILDELEHAREQLAFAKEENRSMAKALEQANERIADLDRTVEQYRREVDTLTAERDTAETERSHAVDMCVMHYEGMIEEYRKSRADAENEAERLKDLVRNLAKML